ncbi:hypothetical protein YA0089_25935 [Pseudomonas viridiflava]|uniref:hypothetical protein n=1 Tax=Pseudomonas viridiflava TaxID=33069 RepID=UPI0018E61891|nr:hypothetical protein [Pseudomonas viridiflava]MBI6727056.1 hypothetical protein [Pseudomonas viridiflava]
MHNNSRFMKEPLMIQARDVVRSEHAQDDCQLQDDYWQLYLEELLAKLDPCPRKKHHKWLLSRIVDDESCIPLSMLSEIDDVRSVLHEFSSVKQYLPKDLRDINMYHSVDDLRSHLHLARLNSGRASKVILDSMEFQDLYQTASVYYEGQDLIIFKPRNIEEAIVLADGAKWNFDDRADGLYSELRKVGTPLIWYTHVGKLLSVIPYEYPFCGSVLDQEGDHQILNEFASLYADLNLSDTRLITAILAADGECPFYADWGVEPKLLAIHLNPFLLEKPEIFEYVEEITEGSDLHAAFWASSMLEVHRSIKDLQCRDL